MSRCCHALLDGSLCQEQPDVVVENQHGWSWLCWEHALEYPNVDRWSPMVTVRWNPGPVRKEKGDGRET